MKSICLLLAAVFVPRSADHANVEPKPLLVWSGPDSQVRQTSYFRAATPAEWRKVWLAHIGRTEENAFDVRLPSVDIDFDKCVVVAVFRGQAANHRGLAVESIAETADEVTLRFDYLTFQTAAPLNAAGKGGGAVRASAYGFILLPATKKTIVLEENVQGLKNQPAKWKERARFKS